MDKLKKEMREALKDRSLFTDDFQDELKNIYNLILKLITDRFLSERVLSNIWNDMTINLAYIQVADTNMCRMVVEDIILQLDRIREKALIAEEYETMRNCKVFFEIMLNNK